MNDVTRIEEGIVTANDLEKDRPTFKEALVSTMVLEAVNRSLKENGKWIEITKDKKYAKDFCINRKIN